MNKTAIKNYAIWARVQLIEAAKQRAFEYEITENGENKTNVEAIGGRLLGKDEKQQRSHLIAQINQKGYAQVMEEAAYTWFNRFIALRFMEVNGYLPSKIRVFTDENGAFKPEILKEAMTIELNGLDRSKVLNLLDKQDNETLYQYLLITQCNALSDVLPVMFERIENWTELLFPANLLRPDSVIGKMISMIPQEDWTDQVQIIGWLYQYYNAEPKDKVFENLKKNIKISKENIPAATQLFTPDWIVRYMVENSLGRLWVEGHPNDELKANWKYYLEEAEQEPEVQAELAEIRKEYSALKPEEIKVIDPCMGSGHILVYMFDVLVQIYEVYGYNAREAAGLILQNNLYGLDIDDRASQLAYFAVMMKARQYDRRIFSRGIQPHVYAIVESNGISRDTLDYFENGDDDLKKAMETIVRELHDAKEYGSILNVTQVDFAALYARLDEIKEDISLFATAAQAELRPLIEIAEAMAQKYHTVVTNPPYMGASGMNPKLAQFIKDNYTDYKSDFFSAFVVKCAQMAHPNGKLGFFTPYVWMFIQSYEKMRQFLYNRTIETLIQFEYSAFEEATVPVCTFAFSNYPVSKKGCYLRLTDFRGGMEVQRKKTLEAIADHKCGFYFEQSTDNFSKIPGSPVAYWVSEKFLKSFNSEKIDDFASTNNGFTTGDNNRFLRCWFEVECGNICFTNESIETAEGKREKWFPYNKGGDFRKWYGNNDFVINWGNNGQEIKAYGHLVPRSLKYQFRECASWNKITSGTTAFRYKAIGTMFDVAGLSMFPKDKTQLLYLLALCNSVYTKKVLEIISPTLNCETGHVASLPVIFDSRKDIIDNLAKESIALSRADWDSFETSWDFKRHPLVAVRDDLAFGQFAEARREKIASQLSECFREWESQCLRCFNQLKENEEELNRIFIDIYGLQDELTPEVDEKDVTVRKADLGRDIRSLISYAVGCMFGRYSLDCEGLAYAGGEWDASKYTLFPADKDNIIPICDDDYFDDDITGRFIKWVEMVYGKETLEENLKFIADALGGKGTPSDVIRGYFLNDFYADHLKTYQKRPIYWLFDSGKKNGFKALIYMHRYQPDTIARMRTDYVHEQQERYRTQLQMLEDSVQTASPSERVKLNKQIAKLKDQALEIQKYEEKIHHLADQMIAIDLDDGVKVNYAKFQDVLEKIK